jgi:hypothetical protein
VVLYNGEERRCKDDYITAVTAVELLQKLEIETYLKITQEVW